MLSGQLEQEIVSALGQLAEQAASAYSGVAVKAGRPSIHRIVNRVLRAMNLPAWVQDRLAPILRNHAARVSLDTQRTVQTEIGLEVRVAEERAQEIAAQAGEHLGLRDIEPQVREVIYRAIREGLAAGENPLKTAQRIRDMVPAGRFVNAGSRYRARLIAINETRVLQLAATLASYESNPNITALRLRDGIYGPPRSDSACIARDGEIVPIEDADSIDFYHVGCTLGVEPVVSGVALSGSADLIPV